MKFTINGAELNNVDGHGINLTGEYDTDISNVTINGAKGDGIRIGRFAPEPARDSIVINLPEGTNLAAFAELLKQLAESPDLEQRRAAVEPTSPWMKALNLGGKTAEVANTALSIANSPALQAAISYFTGK
jgi:hypothetical protein